MERRRPNYVRRAKRNQIKSPLQAIGLVLVIILVLYFINKYEARQSKDPQPAETEIVDDNPVSDEAMDFEPADEQPEVAVAIPPAKSPGDLAKSLMAVKGNDDLPSQIKDYEGFTVNFNSQTHNPNYVAWELAPHEVANANINGGDFMPDTEIEGCAQLADYRRSGFDRGHMAPAADMKWSQAARNQCYYLSNMAPQTHELNAGAWKNVEDKCRARVVRDSALVIICGPVPEREPEHFIGDNQVVVPKKFFKVILAPFAEEPYAIGFLMPNAKVEGGMQAAAVTVDSVEQVTGYDFFSALPDDLEEKLESKVNFNRWSRLQ